MNKTTKSHEEIIFIKIVDVLCASDTDKTDYGLHQCNVRNSKTRLETSGRY